MCVDTHIYVCVGAYTWQATASVSGPFRRRSSRRFAAEPVLKWIGVRSSGFQQIKPRSWFSSRQKTQLCSVCPSSHPRHLYRFFIYRLTTTLLHAPMTGSRRFPLTGRSSFTLTKKSSRSFSPLGNYVRGIYYKAFAQWNLCYTFSVIKWDFRNAFKSGRKLFANGI